MRIPDLKYGMYVPLSPLVDAAGGLQLGRQRLRLLTIRSGSGEMHSGVAMGEPYVSFVSLAVGEGTVDKDTPVPFLMVRTSLLGRPARPNLGGP